ncbi:MAG: glutamyl-tRNA reductase [Terriglobia bacterium]
MWGGLPAISSFDMNLILAGINHRTAPVEVRERMNIEDARLVAALKNVSQRAGIRESIIFSTCNRVEVLVNAEDQLDPEPVIRQFLADFHHCDLAAYEGYLYWRRQQEAVLHLFRVASSLDSMILGEPQILGQVKRAFSIAQGAGSVNGDLYDVVNQALAVGRKVRRETGLGHAAVSVPYAAVELARTIFGRLEGKTLFLIGAGKMSEIASRHLLRSGASEIYVSNRTRERAVELAQRLHGAVIPFDNLHENLHKADIVISSTGASNFIICKEQVEQILALRKHRPVFFVDIAVPRDIDPSVNDLEGAYVYNIDDLQQVVDANRAQREKEAERAEEIVRQEVQKLVRRLASREVAPTIVALEKRLDAIRDQEWARFRSRLATLTADQRDAVDQLTRGILNKILHGPITELKTGAGNPEHGTLVHLVRKIFGVGEGSRGRGSELMQPRPPRPPRPPRGSDRADPSQDPSNPAADHGEV